MKYLIQKQQKTDGGEAAHQRMEMQFVQLNSIRHFINSELSQTGDLQTVYLPFLSQRHPSELQEQLALANFLLSRVCL